MPELGLIGLRCRARGQAAAREEGDLGDSDFGYGTGRGIPLLFPWYALPEDGQTVTLPATGHAGYEPGELTRARLSYSYDEGGTWSATENHSGATGKQASIRSVLTDAHGASVTQSVTRAYDVR
ncbi:hypothetical protein [Streptomyces sp. bgisy027]|uniref:hypothetical protein n=1 Tax=unclassified Streptomyces TaxID=2593676 RepID=UPI003D7169F3